MEASSPAAVIYRTVNRWWWVIFGIFLAVFLPCATWFYFFSEPFRSVGHDFVSALEAADYKQAFDLCCPTLQEQLGDEQGIRRIVEAEGKFYAPALWGRVSYRGEYAELESNQQWGEERYSATMRLEKTGDKWSVSRFSSSGPNQSRLSIPPSSSTGR